MKTREKLAELVNEIRKQGADFNKRKDAGEELWPTGTKEAFDKVNAEHDALRVQLENEEQSERMAARLASIDEYENRSRIHGQQKPGLDDTIPGENRTYGDAGYDRDSARAYAQLEADKRKAFRSFVLAQNAPEYITSEMRDACERLKFNPHERNINVRLADTESYKALQDGMRNYNAGPEKRAVLGKAVSGGGAELIPASFLATMEISMLATSPFLAYVDTITTSTGEPLSWPVGNDTSNEGAMAAEQDDLSAVTQVIPTLSKLTLGAFDAHSKFVKISYQLQRDSAVNVDGILATMLGERLGRTLLRQCTLGVGTTAPTGVVVDAAAGVTAAGATAITAADVINLQHSVDPSYRGNGMFMAHDGIIKAIRLLNDTTGRPLWSSGLKDGIPDSIAGQTLIYNQMMQATLATATITMLYGDFSKYKLRRVGTMRLIRLVERFAETLDTGFLGYMAFDGKVSKAASATVAPIKKLTQA